MAPSLTAEDFRRYAWEWEDPAYLGDQDLMRYVLRLIRREWPSWAADRREFYEPLASTLEWFATMPDRPGRQWTPGDWSAFNTARKLALGYLRRQSSSTPEERLELLHRDYRPDPVPPPGKVESHWHGCRQCREAAERRHPPCDEGIQLAQEAKTYGEGREWRWACRILAAAARRRG
jgi:hypothetical protein